MGGICCRIQYDYDLNETKLERTDEPRGVIIQRLPNGRISLWDQADGRNHILTTIEQERLLKMELSL